MGPVIKVSLLFRERFWEGRKLANLSFLHAPREHFHTMWTYLPLRLPVITCWSGGGMAERIAHLSDEQLRDEAVNTLARNLKMTRSRLEDLVVAAEAFNWQRDPFSRGAYSYAAVGASNVPRELARPVENTLFFAGEATHVGMSGTVAGAIASGRRAAREMMGEGSH